MKHYYSFLIITSLLLAGCGQKDRAKSQFESSVQTEESYSLAKEYIKEAVITGKVLNRDFYPQEKELTLIIPFFWKMENQYRTPIQEDGSFSFRFPVYAKLREVSIRNYAEHLYIHPGDSIHVEIDFKDLFHPKVTGDAEKLNQEILAFTESAYYYIQNYSINPNLNIKDFEAELKKEYDFRLERRNEYLTKYKPMEDVTLFTEELLKQDYYYALLSYGNQCQFKTRKVWENDYNDPIPGETFTYPEFKGYFGDVSWMNIQTKEGTISLTNETPDAYIGVYQPRDGRDRLLYTLPESGISVLNVIPPVRNKVNSTDLCGPSSQPKWVNGPQTGRVIFRFM